MELKRGALAKAIEGAIELEKRYQELLKWQIEYSKEIAEIMKRRCCQ